MATFDEGIVTVTHRPIMTMDPLHVLLLASVIGQRSETPFIAQVFSLPSEVVEKELIFLETYGLTRKSGDCWSATDQGEKLISIWSYLQYRGETVLQTNCRKWLLGPGEFVADEMIRDRDEIETVARRFGLNRTDAAVRFLEDRRDVASRFDELVLAWPSKTKDQKKFGLFTEFLVFQNIGLAETHEALRRLEELFEAQIYEVIRRAREMAPAKGNADGDGSPVLDPATLERRGQEERKKFLDERRIQRKRNSELTERRIACEALLAGQWLSGCDATLTTPSTNSLRP